MSHNERLVTTPNIAQQDDFYAELLMAHEGMNDEDSQVYNTRLILILANHIGSIEVLKQALAVAK